MIFLSLKQPFFGYISNYFELFIKLSRGFHITILSLFVILHFKDPGFIPFDNSKTTFQIEDSFVNKPSKKSITKSTKSTNDLNNLMGNKFNIKRLEGKNIQEFNEKIMKKTLDVSLANEENSHNRKGKEEYEESNEILEEVELNNIADDNNNPDNVVIDYKNEDKLNNKDEKLLTFAKNEEIISLPKEPKSNEIESITIEIRSKHKENNNQDQDKSKVNSLCFTPPSISSSFFIIVNILILNR